MDVEFEEVEEWIRHGIYGAIYVALNPILQFKRLIGFGAGWERYVLEVMCRVLDMLARFSMVASKHKVGQLEMGF